jgi:predicted RNA binding protein with dsRBD fold (UPF0201 family)
MGRIKQLLIESTAEDKAILDTIKPKVHVLMCNGKPVHTYVDKQTAEYEMHLCIQGDEQELGQINSYSIITLELSTHRID